MQTVSVLAAELAKMPGVADRLLARHVADGLGYCRGCELPQAGPTRWPCTLYHVADVARTTERTRGLPVAVLERELGHPKSRSSTAGRKR